MKRYVTKLVSLFTRVFDGCLSALEIKDFVVRKYKGLKIKPAETENVLDELNYLKNNLVYLEWIEENEFILTGKSILEKDVKLNIVHWSKNLENNRIINKGIIAKGTGINLDMLDENSEDLKGFTTNSIESLLKFVEVKRKRFMRAFSQDLTTEERVLEGLRITILFSKVSRRHNDLRFLNTAFKMNDWYYPFFKSALAGRLLINYLLAVTEQELSAAELLK